MPTKSTKKFPKISIVMPSFNQVDYIERSIRSIIYQDYPNLEFIVIDGNSNDGTKEILDKYKDNFSFYISEKDNGQSDALNKGFSYATGDIYGWLNSDDLYLPNSLFLISSLFLKNHDKKIIFGDWLSIDKNDRILDFNHAFDFNLNHFKYEGFHLNAQSMFWRSEVHKNFSGFEIDLYNTMDYQMIMEFGINEGEKSFLRAPYVFGAFRRYTGQKTSNFNQRVLKEHKKIASKYFYYDKYSFRGEIKRLIYRARRAIWYLYRGGFLNLLRRIKLAYFS